MSQRDNEIDELLKPLRGIAPNDLQLRRWQAAVQAEKRGSLLTLSATRMWLQTVAAMVLGILIGGALMSSMNEEKRFISLVAKNSHADATFEHSHTNLD